jgi:hypothetical protein
MKPLASFPLPQLWSDKWPLQRLALYLYPYQPPLQFVACEELTQLALSSCNVWARQKRLKFLDSKSAQCWINQTLVGKICSDFWGHNPSEQNPQRPSFMCAACAMDLSKRGWKSAPPMLPSHVDSSSSAHFSPPRGFNNDLE